MLREDGTAVIGASELASGGPKPSAASLELLPWEMQLVMELCDQGTLREALDAGSEVDDVLRLRLRRGPLVASATRRVVTCRAP